MNRGVIFDFDGVIVDSVESLFRVYYEVVEELGGVGEIDISHLNGLTITQICQYIIDHYNIPSTLNKILELYYSKLDKVYESSKGIISTSDLITCFGNNNIPMSIASGCPEVFIRSVLHRLSLFEYFSQIVGGDSISCGKPDPEVFAKCLQKSQFDSAMVIDDSNSGVLAALRSGCTVVKFDDCIKYHPKLNELMSYQFENYLSYLGTFQNFDVRAKEKLYQTNKKEDKVWAELEKEGSYNAPILIFDIDKTVVLSILEAFLIDYKYYRVKNEAHMALAVTGVVRNSEQDILVGKRAGNSFQYPGKTDLVPAGSLESTDYIAQLDSEWHEETNCENKVKWNPDIMLVVNHTKNVLDIVVNGYIDSLSAKYYYSPEFQDFQWINIDEYSIDLTTPSSYSIMKYMLPRV